MIRIDESQLLKHGSELVHGHRLTREAVGLEYLKDAPGIDWPYGNVDQGMLNACQPNLELATTARWSIVNLLNAQIAGVLSIEDAHAKLVGLGDVFRCPDGSPECSVDVLLR